MKKFFCIFFGFLIFASSLSAKEIRVLNEGAYLKDYTLDELIEEFKDLNYDRFLKPLGNTYPRLFVENLPKDMDSVENKTIRNQIFMQILMPYILKINQEISEDRKDLLALKLISDADQDFDDFQREYIEEMAQKYEVVTPFKDTRRYMKLLNELILRVDVVPPSIMIATAAAYSKWGTSRIAIEGNNLYKERNWYSDEGIKPIGEDENEPYRYKIFPSLEESIRAYHFKINTGVNYEIFRNARLSLHRRDDTIYGIRLVWALVADNNMTNYAGLLDYIITFYRMNYFDEAILEDEYDFED